MPTETPHWRAMNPELAESVLHPEPESEPAPVWRDEPVKEAHDPHAGAGEFSYAEQAAMVEEAARAAGEPLSERQSAFLRSRADERDEARERLGLGRANRRGGRC